MDFKSMAIAATLSGSVLMTGAVFTGTVNLSDIKNMGFGWAEKVNQAVDSTGSMLSKFNLFKADVTSLLNSKIATINSLNQRIADLKSQVGNGEISLESANNEISRLNEELAQAESEIQTLKDEYGVKDTEVQEAFAEMKTSADMDTTLNLDTQTETPSDTTETTSTDTNTGSTTTNEFATQEASILSRLQSQYPSATDITVNMTDATHVTISSSAFVNASASDLESTVSAGLYPQTVTYQSGASTTTWTFVINQ